MNFLTAKFSWNRDEEKIVNGKTKFSNGILDLHVLRIHGFVFNNDNIFHNNNRNITCAIIGYISNLQEIKSIYSINSKNDVEVIEKLYSLVGPKLIYELDGIFTIAIWDGEKQKGYIFQDEYASNLPLYYRETKEGLIISTSLKEILKQVSFRRELNLSAIYDFLEFRVIVPNKSTLIKGINKLLPRQYIFIDGIKSRFKIKSLKPRVKRVLRHFAKKNIVTCIGNKISILQSQLDGENPACTLSSGFDSNTVLYFLARSSKDITAVTIGGKLKNEIPNASKLASQYDNVRHISSVVRENGLNTFPDIVWRLEGYTCERGLFLQCELAKLLKKMEIRSIFLGECADQVLDQHKRSWIYYANRMTKQLLIYLYQAIKERGPSKDIRKSKIMKRIRGFSLYLKYNGELDFILKKSGIMLNSYGIQGIYPYLNKEIIMISWALRKLNKRKSYYKEEVKKLLGVKKSNFIEKQFGTTDIEYLLEEKEEMISKLVSSKLIKEIISNEQIFKITKNPAHYYDLILRILFIYLFNELFISGKFDSRLGEPNLDIALNTFFN